MGAVNEHRHTASPALGRNRRHRKHQRGLCGDVIHHDQLCPRRERSYERVDDVTGIAQRKWHLHGSQRRSAIACHGTSRQRNRTVREIGDQHFVCRAERDGSKHRVETGRDVGDEHEIVGTRPEKRRDLRDRFAVPRLETPRHRLLAIQLAEHEPRWLALHLVAQGLLLLENPPRRSADRAVIEIGHVRIEEPVFPHRMTESRHAWHSRPRPTGVCKPFRDWSA